VDECCGLEGVVRPFPAQIGGGEAPQFRVDDRDQFGWVHPLGVVFGHRIPLVGASLTRGRDRGTVAAFHAAGADRFRFSREFSRYEMARRHSIVSSLPKSLRSEGNLIFHIGLATRNRSDKRIQIALLRRAGVGDESRGGPVKLS
jgi:hypothetical protein